VTDPKGKVLGFIKFKKLVLKKVSEFNFDNFDYQEKEFLNEYLKNSIYFYQYDILEVSEAKF
jgi:hypothetical protein